MTVKIEISSEQYAALTSEAAAQGLSLEEWFRKYAERAAGSANPDKPFTTGYGMLAEYGTAPSAAEIDENRREMFRGFAL